MQPRLDILLLSSMQALARDSHDSSSVEQIMDSHKSSAALSWALFNFFLYLQRVRN